MIKQGAVILFSGGIDATVVLAELRAQNIPCYTLCFDYGQRSRAEIIAAEKLADYYGATHRLIKLPLGFLSNSALINKDLNVSTSINTGISQNYVPARNLIFFSIAIAWAEVLKINDIYYGANADDFRAYPDCRDDFLKAFEQAVNLGTKTGVDGQTIKLHAPLIKLSKAEIIEKGQALGVDFSMTTSCYQPNNNGSPCEVCESCLIRLEAFSACDPLGVA